MNGETVKIKDEVWYLFCDALLIFARSKHDTSEGIGLLLFSSTSIENYTIDRRDFYENAIKMLYYRVEYTGQYE